jgi:hypothetical protein
MPPLILIAAGILGGAALVRFAIREGKRINRELDDARRAKPGEQDSLPKLRRDPGTGTYRPG